MLWEEGTENTDVELYVEYNLKKKLFKWKKNFSNAFAMNNKRNWRDIGHEVKQMPDWKHPPYLLNILCIYSP